MRTITHTVMFKVDDDQTVLPELVFELLTGLKSLSSLNNGILGLEVNEIYSEWPNRDKDNPEDKEPLPF